MDLLIGSIYALIRARVFIRIGILRTLGILFQAPICGWLIFIVLRYTSFRIVVGRVDRGIGADYLAPFSRGSCA
jgi:hypothetical protein